jgi:hypothetical protein
MPATKLSLANPQLNAEPARVAGWAATTASFLLEFRDQLY